MTARTLHLAEGLTAPLDAATGTFGVVGQRGTGKSTSAAVLVEQLVGAGGRAVIADPTGVWWGLAHPGRGPGLPAIIFGGEHGDVPLEETGGQLVADVVLGGSHPVYVLDLKLLRKGQQVRFMAEFCEALYHGNREALHFVIDEAGRFAPQVLREPGGHGARLLGAIEDIVKLGRSRGLGCTLIEQRPAHINKSVFEQIETLFAFRLMGPNDRRAIHGWIEAQGDPAREKEVMDSMSKMKTGQALVWSPATLEVFGLKTFHLAETFDSRATPKVGAAVRAPKKRTAVDLAALRDQMAATIERAKANDPKALRARIAELERELARKPVAAAPAPKRIEVPVWTHAELDRLDAAAAKIREAAAAVRGAVTTVATGVAVTATATPHPVRMRTTLSQALTTAEQELRDAALPKAQRLILSALMQYPQGRSVVQIAILTGYALNGGGFQNAIGSLRTKQLVQGSRDRLEITAAGAASLGPVEPLPTGRALLEHWLGQLSKAERSALTALAEAWPGALTREDLAARAGYAASGGGFQNALGRLRTLELIEGRQELRATSHLMEGAA